MDSAKYSNQEKKKQQLSLYIYSLLTSYEWAKICWLVLAGGWGGGACRERAASSPDVLVIEHQTYYS